MVMRHGGGTECERGVFRAKRKRERVSATPIERHQKVAEERVRGAEPGEAQRHEGAGDPAVGTCCLCGNECCRPCRSKSVRFRQHAQPASATAPKMPPDGAGNARPLLRRFGKGTSARV
ncbi:MAG: hypothetical protein DBY37_05720 [Desulfovibrionaceae bacterium]|nr:MAG: hypothetical protein DBY37_05720 [Desulfovibrionaceae bacterium]